jgi:hypothetical protein
LGIVWELFGNCLGIWWEFEGNLRGEKITNLFPDGREMVWEV